MRHLSALLLALVFAITVLWGNYATVNAEEYPSKNIRWIVGVKPGGGYDIYSRAIGRYMEKFLPKGVHVVVENRPGAAFQIGANAIYNAKPDGYTIGIWPAPGLYIPQMFFKPKYDLKKVTWLATILREPAILSVAKSSKLKTLADFKAAEYVRVPMTGFSGPEISAPITFEKMGIKGKYITGHNSSKGAVLSAVRGDGDAVLYSYGTSRKFIKGGDLTPLLLLGADKRAKEFPNVPTATEAGFPKLDEVIASWRVIGAPPNLPADRKKYLRDLIWKTLNDKEFLEWSKKSKRAVSPLDGEATEKAMMALFADYDEMKGLISKYVK